MNITIFCLIILVDLINSINRLSGVIHTIEYGD